MITIKSSGSFNNTDSFLKRLLQDNISKSLESYGQLGVELLSNATPVDTGLTAASWTYDVDRSFGKHTITWRNTNVNSGQVIAILIEYGHGTGTGGWVEGYDYINPTIQPLFDKIATEIWKEVIDD